MSFWIIGVRITWVQLYMWNPSTCDCQCDKTYKVVECLNIKNCSCNKRLFNKWILASENWIVKVTEATSVADKKDNIYIKNTCLVHTIPMNSEYLNTNEYLNTKHAYIKFTNEKEVNGSLPFLDVLISRNNKGFTTAVYHKSTFSGVYSNFNSFIADENKHGLIFTLLFRIFSIISDFSKFHEKVNYLKDVLKKNSFPTTSSG